MLAAAVCGWTGWAGPATATWVGGGDRTNLSDPANWQCKDSGGNVIADAIPTTDSTAVSITGNTSFNCPLGATPIWKSIAISGTVTLTADCDWRGAGDFNTMVNANATIQMAGHNLQVKVPNSGTSRRINVNDASAKGSGGEFHLYVPANMQFNNSGGWGSDNVIWYSGSLKFVKDGPGTYVPYYSNGNTGDLYYKYTGGTVFHEGLVYLGNDGEGTKNETYYAMNQRPLFGPKGGSAGGITVDAGATFNYKGIYDIGNHYKPFVLNGGTLSCDRAPANPDYGGINDVRLMADSNFSFSRPAHVCGPWTLNGHTLAINTTANTAIFYCRAGTIANGTVKVTGEGPFKSAYAAITATDNVTLDMGSPLFVDYPITVSNYIARYTGTSNSGTALFTVTGTFTPIADNFYSVTMANGSKIDLSSHNGAWSTTGTSFGSLRYVDGATITIDVGERTLVQNDQVLAWSAIPAGVHFRIVGKNIYANEAPKVDAAGVYYDLGDLAQPALAHWTGAGARNNFADPANWVCTNGANQAMANVAPNASTAVFFEKVNFDALDATAFRAQLATYKSYVFAPRLTLTSACDWSGLDVNDELLLNKTFDLQGNTLTLTGVNGASIQTFTVTDTATEGGKLVFTVPQDTTFINATITINGSLMLEKTGPGTFIPKKFATTQDYKGGTLVSGGTLKLYNDDVADSSTYSMMTNRTGVYGLGFYPSTITIGSGATLDINGIYDLNMYEWHFAGGTLVNSKKQTRYDWGGFGSVVLEADSEFNLAQSVQFCAGKAWNLNGHTLTMNLAAGIHAYLVSMSASNGTMVVTGTGYLDIPSPGITFNGVTLDMAAPEWLSGSVTVPNLIARYTGTGAGGAQAYHVRGRFTPVVDHFHDTTVYDGATLDLSLQSGAFNAASATGSLKYDVACSNLTVDVGVRAIVGDTQLIAWPAIPAGVKFTLVGENVTAGGQLAYQPTGLYYVFPESTLVVAATWTGNGEPNDINDPANWSCQNALGNTVANGVPGRNARVRLVGNVGNVLATTAATSPWQQCVVGSITLTEDLDLRAFGAYTSFFETGATIDLKGHKLYVQGPSGTIATAYTITDSTTDTAHPGEFHLNVASGVSFVNTGTTFAGNLKFVKEGAGTFSSGKFKLDYYGGNLIAAGDLIIYNDTKVDSTTYAFGQNGYPNPLGRYATPITINAGATVDMKGNYDTSRYNWVLNGGTVKNTKEITQNAWGGFANITLTSNSTVNVGTKFFINGNVDLGGNTLTAQIGSGVWFYLRSSSFKNGCLDAVSGGYLAFPAALDMRTVDLKAGAALAINGDVSVRDYYAKYNGDWSVGTAALNVYGTFTPNDNYFYGCTMQNGSTIDLSKKTAPWSVSSLNTKTTVTNVTFVANSTITVDIHDREFDFTGVEEVKVVDWKSQPPPATTHFIADPATKRHARCFVKKEDGLYLIRSSLVIIVR